jgi:hypothetical protein
MNFRHLIFRTTLEFDFSFDQFYGLMKNATRDGLRFKLGTIDRDYLSVYYYNDYANTGYREKLGLDTVPGIQVTAERTNNPEGKTLINFKVANYVIILWVIVSLTLFIFLYYEFQLRVAITTVTIFATFAYLIQLRGYFNQLFYFKHDLESLSNKIKLKQRTD